MGRWEDGKNNWGLGLYYRRSTVPINLKSIFPTELQFNY
jgi:hypothetical protein